LLEEVEYLILLISVEVSINHWIPEQLGVVVQYEERITENNNLVPQALMLLDEELQGLELLGITSMEELPILLLPGVVLPQKYRCHIAEDLHDIGSS
jgi:hypothetical protein